MKKVITLVLALLITTFICGTSEASVGTKQYTVNYSNIKINLNGKQVNILPEREPFIINGTTYLPLRAVVEAMNFNVAWQDATKTVEIVSKDSADVTALKHQLTIKDQEILALKEQINKLKYDDDIDDLQEELIDDYTKIVRVPIEDISLEGDEDEIDVNVEVDLGDYQSRWADLTDSEIKTFLKNMTDQIQDAISANTRVAGYIEDIDSGKSLVKYNKNGKRTLVVSYYDSKYRDSGAEAADVIADLKGETYDVKDIDFTVSTVRYYDTDDKVTLKLYADDNNAEYLWGRLTSTTRKSEVKLICRDIVDIFYDDADIDLETVLISLYDEDNSLLQTYTYDVDRESIT